MPLTEKAKFPDLQMWKAVICDSEAGALVIDMKSIQDVQPSAKPKRKPKKADVPEVAGQDRQQSAVSAPKTIKIKMLDDFNLVVTHATMQLENMKIDVNVALRQHIINAFHAVLELLFTKTARLGDDKQLLTWSALKKKIMEYLRTASSAHIAGLPGKVTVAGEKGEDDEPIWEWAHVNLFEFKNFIDANKGQHMSRTQPSYLRIRDMVTRELGAVNASTLSLEDAITLFIQQIDQVISPQWMGLAASLLDKHADGSELAKPMQDAHDMLFGSEETLFEVFRRRSTYMVSMMHEFFSQSADTIVQGVHLSQYAEHADALIPLSSSDSDMPSVAARVTLWMNIARLCSEATSAPDFVMMLRRVQALTQGMIFADAESAAIPEHVQGDVSASVDAQGQEQAEITAVDVPEINEASMCSHIQMSMMTQLADKCEMGQFEASSISAIHTLVGAARARTLELLGEQQHIAGLYIKDGSVWAREIHNDLCLPMIGSINLMTEDDAKASKDVQVPFATGLGVTLFSGPPGPADAWIFAPAWAVDVAEEEAEVNVEIEWYSIRLTVQVKVDQPLELPVPQQAKAKPKGRGKRAATPPMFTSPQCALLAQAAESMDANSMDVVCQVYKLKPLPSAIGSSHVKLVRERRSWDTKKSKKRQMTAGQEAPPTQQAPTKKAKQTEELPKKWAHMFK